MPVLKIGNAFLLRTATVQHGKDQEDSTCLYYKPGNTKGRNITVPLTSCLTSLESAVGQLTIYVFICKTD